MAITFLEPGGDATFNVALTTAGGFWNNATATLATDFVYGGHIKSIKYAPNTSQTVNVFNKLLDAGARVSLYIYIVTLPTATAKIFGSTGGFPGQSVAITSGGVLKLLTGSSTQIGSDGSTLSTGIWYRLSLAQKITSSSINRFELFLNGASAISVTDATLGSTGNQTFQIGNISSDTTFDFRSSDHYVDDSSSLNDTGNIWVTAKRPNANGTTNGFTTQIGSGGSGYGTGHSPQVNERPLSTTNGWSMVGVGSAVTEEYNIEAKATGDINISTATIVDYLGWVSTSALVGETVQIIVGGVNFAQAITSTTTLYTKIAGSTTYPAGTGADIGITTDTSLTTVSLYECGIIVAYIPLKAITGVTSITGINQITF